MQKKQKRYLCDWLDDNQSKLIVILFIIILIIVFTIEYVTLNFIFAKGTLICVCGLIGGVLVSFFLLMVLVYLIERLYELSKLKKSEED